MAHAPPLPPHAQFGLRVAGAIGSTSGSKAALIPHPTIADSIDPGACRPLDDVPFTGRSLA